MCLAIPGPVTDIDTEHEVMIGTLVFNGVRRRVCLEHVSGVGVGEFVLVHLGFALQRVDEMEAREVFAFLERMNQLDELDAPQTENDAA